MYAVARTSGVNVVADLVAKVVAQVGALVVPVVPVMPLRVPRGMRGSPRRGHDADGQRQRDAKDGEDLKPADEGGRRSHPLWIGR